MSWKAISIVAAVLIGIAVFAEVVRFLRDERARDRILKRDQERFARMMIPRNCQDCGELVEPARRAWNAPTCQGCSATGCPKSLDAAERGDRCDSCDCLPPVDVWPVHG